MASTTWRSFQTGVAQSSSNCATRALRDRAPHTPPFPSGYLPLPTGHSLPPPSGTATTVGGVRLSPAQVRREMEQKRRPLKRRIEREREVLFSYGCVFLFIYLFICLFEGH
ncbi:unnamed protein product [Musa textilis]